MVLGSYVHRPGRKMPTRRRAEENQEPKMTRTPHRVKSIDVQCAHEEGERRLRPPAGPPAQAKRHHKRPDGDPPHHWHGSHCSIASTPTSTPAILAAADSHIRRTETVISLRCWSHYARHLLTLCLIRPCSRALRYQTVRLPVRYGLHCEDSRCPFPGRTE